MATNCEPEAEINKPDRISRVPFGNLEGCPQRLSDALLWLLDDTFHRISEKELKRAVRAMGRRRGMLQKVRKALARVYTTRGDTIRPVDATRLAEWCSIQYLGKRLREKKALGQGVKEKHLKRPRDKGKFMSSPTYSAKTMTEIEVHKHKAQAKAQGYIVGESIFHESTSCLTDDIVTYFIRHAKKHARTAQQNGILSFSNYDQGEVSSRNACCTLHCIYPEASGELAYLDTLSASKSELYHTQLQIVFQQGYRCMHEYLVNNQKGLVERFEACYAYHRSQPSWVFMNRLMSYNTMQEGERIGNIIPHVDTSSTFGTVVILLSDVDDYEQFLVWDDVGVKHTSSKFHRKGATIAFPGSTVHCTVEPSARPHDRYTMNLFF